MTTELGRYTNLEKIGQGGFATVYRAYDTILGRPVALKELHPQLLNNREWVQRFTREAQTIARLDHRRIVTIFDVVEKDERLFIVMRLVNGTSLDIYLSTKGPLSWAETLAIMHPISEGLEFAHSQGILHRDLKPANILLDSHRGALLSDFGLAKLVGEAGSSFTAAGGIVGTPHYIAPEVWEGQGAKQQSDIYALGCILYEMLTGEMLFQGESPPAVMMAHFKPLVLPKSWPESVPPSITDALKIALAREPDDRYATAREMITDLIQIAETEPKATPAKVTPIRTVRTPGSQGDAVLPLLQQPETKYAYSGDISIAYQVMGKGPFDLVVIPPFVSHLEVAWEYAPYVRFLTHLASFSRLIVFDKRGTGLSDRTVNIASLEERMDDVRAVMDAVGSERAALFGISEGGPMSVLFAATYPERTLALVMYGSGAKFVWSPDYPWAKREKDWPGALEWFRQNWGREGRDTIMAPSLADDEEFQLWWAKFCRLGASPGAVATLWKMNSEIDVRPILPTIRVPTLVVHRTGDLAVSVEAGRYIAGLIPKAKFVELPGDGHAWWTDEILLKEIETFLRAKRQSIEPDRVLATILFTDIVDSQKMVAKMGDRQWEDILKGYDQVARNEITRFRGRAIKKIGDRFLTIFDGPTRAVHCAQALREQVKVFGIDLRAGLHIGEVEVRDEDVAGSAVDIAAGVLSMVRNNEIWVSKMIKDLVAGAGFHFGERGTFHLGDLPNEWQLFAVEE